MGCWHGIRGCGPWYGPPRWTGWYEPADWYDEGDWPIPPRYARRRPPDREVATSELEAQLAELRDELRRIETELGRLQANGPAAGPASANEAAGRG
jgi:hypothetical protein